MITDREDSQSEASHESDGFQWPGPKTEERQRELLRAGYVASGRLLSALQEIKERGMGADVDDCLEILLEDAIENADLLFQFVHYVPEMMGVGIAAREDDEGAPFDSAFQKVRTLRRNGEFAA